MEIKAMNTTLNKFMKEWFYNSRKSVCPAHPSIYSIEITNNCNLNCIMCPINVMKRKKGFMEFSIFQKIIDECKDYTNFLWLHNFGEPLLHPKLFEIVRYCKQKGVSVGLSTNATLLNPESSKDILDSGLDQIILSFDGATQKTYEKIRVGADFKKVRANIVSFLTMKKKMRSTKPITILQIIMMRDTETEIKRFSEFWKAVGPDQVIVKRFDTWGGQVKAIKEHAQVSHTSKHYGLRGDVRYPCYALWDSMVILWDGKVVPCCEDFDGKMVLGDIKDSSVEEIWNSNPMVNLRNKHVRGEFDTIPLCRECSEYEAYPHNPLWPIDPNLFRRFSLLSKLFFSGKIAPSIFRG